MQKMNIPWQPKWPLWCFTHCSVAWVEGGNKEFLFGDSPSSVPKASIVPPLSACACPEKAASVTGAPHTWLEASSALAVKDIAGETCILVPGWDGSRRENTRAPSFSPELENPPHGTRFAGFALSWRVCTE